MPKSPFNNLCAGSTFPKEQTSTGDSQQLKSDSLYGPSEIEKMWHKVEKMDPLIFRPEITYGMLRIVI